MPLGEKQIKLCRALNVIEAFFFAMGYDPVREDARRAEEVHGKFGVKSSYSAAFSVHKLKLAQDYTIKRDGKYPLPEKEEARILNQAHDIGDMLGLAKRINGDLGHFSMEHQGHR